MHGGEEMTSYPSDHLKIVSEFDMNVNKKHEMVIKERFTLQLSVACQIGQLSNKTNFQSGSIKFFP